MTDEPTDIPDLDTSAIIVVRPKKPYLDWARSVFEDDLGLDDLTNQSNAYLVPDVEDESQLHARRNRWYQRVFENELIGWTRDLDAWPKDRSWRAFRSWFDVELHPLVYDMRDFH